MLKLVTTATAIPVWMVHLRAEFAAAVPLHPAGLAVAVGLSAPDATAALERARELVASCARYAGLGAVTIHRVGVAPRPAAGGSGGRADA